MMKMKIAVLTSGGDAPGMNAAIRGVVRTALSYGMEAYGVHDGYKGLYEGKIDLMKRNDVGQILNRGGTILGSSRLPEFKQKEVRAQCINNLKALGIDALVTIGGDGTYRGAMDLSAEGMPCIALPGTIDNDIASTEYTIGFFTALETAVDALDKLRDTSFSHKRCTVVEVMGRYCGDLAIYAGIACGAEIVITRDTGFNKEEIFRQVQHAKEIGKRHLVIVVAEHITDVQKLAEEIQANSPYEARASVLGYIQRGGDPCAFDRILASKMGSYAVELIRQGIGGQAIFCRSLEVGHCPINDALGQDNRPSDLYQYLSKLN
jgi:6-phosphofructokinase 1